MTKVVTKNIFSKNLLRLRDKKNKTKTDVIAKISNTKIVIFETEKSAKQSKNSNLMVLKL